MTSGETVILETAPDPGGPFGAKGVGEDPIIAIGPVTVAASMFPKAVRDNGNPELLHRICRVYSLVGVAVPFSIANRAARGPATPGYFTVHLADAAGFISGSDCHYSGTSPGRRSDPLTFAAAALFLVVSSITPGPNNLMLMDAAGGRAVVKMKPEA